MVIEHLPLGAGGISPGLAAAQSLSRAKIDIGLVSEFALAYLALPAGASPWDAASAVQLPAGDAQTALIVLGPALDALSELLIGTLRSNTPVVIHTLRGYTQERAWPESQAGEYAVHVVRTVDRLIGGPLVCAASSPYGSGFVDYVAKHWPCLRSRHMRFPDAIDVGGCSSQGAGEEESIDDEGEGYGRYGAGLPWIIDEVLSEYHRSAAALRGALALRIIAHNFGALRGGQGRARDAVPGVRAGCLIHPWDIEVLLHAALDLDLARHLLEADAMSEPAIMAGWRRDAALFVQAQHVKWGAGRRPRTARYDASELREIMRIRDLARAESGGTVADRAVSDALRLAPDTLRRAERKVVEAQESGSESEAASAPDAPATSASLVLAEPQSAERHVGASTLSLSTTTILTTAAAISLPGGVSLSLETLDALDGSRAERLAALDTAISRSRGVGR